MKVAIIGSRIKKNSLLKIILKNLPAYTTEIVSGGAEGIDQYAEEIARELSIPTKIFYPEYEKFGRAAPLKRNLKILEYADEVIAFWDLHSKGTKQVIVECIKQNKPVKIVPIKQ